MVDKVACHSCTVCPPAIVLRLFIADTISFATVYVLNHFASGTNTANSFDTIVEHQLNRLKTEVLFNSLAKMMFSGLHYIAEHWQSLR